MNGLRFYALSINWSLLLLLSASCVIVGAKFALEKEFLPAWLRYLAMQRRYRWMNHLPANSPWTTVNQLLLGGRAPTDRLKLLLRSPSILESYSVFLPVVVIRVRCPHLKMRCKTMAAALARRQLAPPRSSQYTQATFPSFGFCAQLHTTSHHQNQGAFTRWANKIFMI